MNDQEKVRVLTRLLETNSGSVTVDELCTVLGTARRARRAIFMARKAGLLLQAQRSGGRAVEAYTLIVPAQNAVEFTEAVSRLKPKRKPKLVKQKLAKPKKKAKISIPADIPEIDEEVLGEAS